MTAVNSTPSPGSHAGPAGFDAPRFGRALRDRRIAHGWSTRDLAEKAGISQAYVVALERPAGSVKSRAQVPTIAVVARLAHALGLAPLTLAAIALRPPSRHVLLVVDDEQRCPLDRARTGAHPLDPEAWVWSASDLAPVNGTGVATIDLRRDGADSYEPDRVASALRAELSVHRGALADRTIGLVFADTSRVMERLDQADAVMGFEHQWHDEVTAATNLVGARPTWDVCVYERRALQALPDPIAATMDLLTSHDEGWFAAGDDVIPGRDGAAAILTRLRPARQRADAWRRRVDGLLAQLDRAG